jgi:CubicO group peptidase (beta-lactamase class C family)
MGDKQKAIDDAADAVLAKWGVPNIAAVIVRDQGQTVLHSARGVRDASKSSTAASNTVDKSDYFNVGSVSKPIFGLMLAALIKQNVLTWDTTVQAVFPEFASPAFRARCGTNATFLQTKVKELMGHVSGIDGHVYFTVDSAAKDAQTDTDPFRLLADQGIANGGNTRDVEFKNLQSVMYQRYLYAVLSMKKKQFVFGSPHNDGYKNTAPSGYGSASVIIAAMIERRLGKPFETVMDELLAGPLPMKIKHGNLPNGMQYHSYDTATSKYAVWSMPNNSFAPFTSKFTVGGIHCTVEGMAQYLKYNIRALDHSSKFDVLAYQQPIADWAQGGLALGGGANHEPLNHKGETGGSLALVYVYPTGGRGFCVMLNADHGPVPGKPNGNAADSALSELFAKIQDIDKNWSSM